MNAAVIRIPILSVALALASCAAPPPRFTSASPVSPEAPEGVRFPRRTSLEADEATRKTTALLSAARKEQEHWDAYGPVSGNPQDEPKDNIQPNMKHEHP